VDEAAGGFEHVVGPGAGGVGAGTEGGGGFAEGGDGPVGATEVVRGEPVPPEFGFGGVKAAAAAGGAGAVFGAEEGDPIFQGGGAVVAQGLAMAGGVEVDGVGDVGGDGDGVAGGFGALLVPVAAAADDEGGGVEGADFWDDGLVVGLDDGPGFAFGFVPGFVHDIGAAMVDGGEGGEEGAGRGEVVFGAAHGVPVDDGVDAVGDAGVDDGADAVDLGGGVALVVAGEDGDADDGAVPVVHEVGDGGGVVELFTDGGPAVEGHAVQGEGAAGLIDDFIARNAETAVQADEGGRGGGAGGGGAAGVQEREGEGGESEGNVTELVHVRIVWGRLFKALTLSQFHHALTLLQGLHQKGHADWRMT